MRIVLVLLVSLVCTVFASPPPTVVYRIDMGGPQVTYTKVTVERMTSQTHFMETLLNPAEDFPMMPSNTVEYYGWGGGLRFDFPPPDLASTFQILYGEDMENGSHHRAYYFKKDYKTVGVWLESSYYWHKSGVEIEAGGVPPFLTPKVVGKQLVYGTDGKLENGEICTAFTVRVKTVGFQPLLPGSQLQLVVQGYQKNGNGQIVSERRLGTANVYWGGLTTVSFDFSYLGNTAYYFDFRFIESTSPPIVD